jgi:predicted MPP superfamily phosphohydrolase
MKGIYKMVEKIVVIGDIHADYERLLAVLKKSELINDKLEWSGGKTYLVMIGDLVDGKSRIDNWTGDSDLKVINYLNKLMKQAKRKDGNVIILLGNHEFMNIRGNFSYSGEHGIKEMGGELKRLKYFNNQFRAFGRKCFLAVNIGGWIFCHAGIPPEISKKYPIIKLNSLLQKFLSQEMSIHEENVFFDIISGDNGILTTREFGTNDVSCKRLTTTLTNLNANYMVIGHTVQEKVNEICNKKLWRVDVGLSRAFGNNSRKRLGFLVIYDNGKKMKIF